MELQARADSERRMSGASPPLEAGEHPSFRPRARAGASACRPGALSSVALVFCLSVLPASASADARQIPVGDVPSSRANRVVELTPTQVAALDRWARERRRERELALRRVSLQVLGLTLVGDQGSHAGEPVSELRPGVAPTGSDLVGGDPALDAAPFDSRSHRSLETLLHEADALSVIEVGAESSVQGAGPQAGGPILRIQDAAIALAASRDEVEMGRDSEHVVASEESVRIGGFVVTARIRGVDRIEVALSPDPRWASLASTSVDLEESSPPRRSVYALTAGRALLLVGPRLQRRTTTRVALPLLGQLPFVGDLLALERSGVEGVRQVSIVTGEVLSAPRSLSERPESRLPLRRTNRIPRLLLQGSGDFPPVNPGDS